LHGPEVAGEEGQWLVPDARSVALESRNHILLADEPAWTQFRTELREFLGSVDAAPGEELPEMSRRELGRAGVGVPTHPRLAVRRTTEDRCREQDVEADKAEQDCEAAP
jgi:hypothetical protein